MGRLSPYEEERAAHHYHSYALISGIFFCFSLIAISLSTVEHFHYTAHIANSNFGWVFQIAITAGRTHDVSLDEVEYRHWDGHQEFRDMVSGNYTPKQIETVLKNKWTNYKYKRIVENPKQNRNRVPQSDSFATFLRDKYRVLFGATENNICLYKQGGRPSGFPSILRTIELSSSAQLLLRSIVLSSFFVRWFFTYVKCASILNVSRGNLIRSICHIVPKLQLIESIFAFLITCLHHDQDASLRWLLPVVWIGYAISNGLYMLTYTMMILMDGASQQINVKIAQIRFICLCVCSMCAPIWIQSQQIFLLRKPCFTEVPAREAFAEYATAISVFIFVASQIYDLRNFWGLLSCEDHDFIPEINDELFDRYEPAEADKRRATKRDKLSEGPPSPKGSTVFLLSCA